MGLLGTVLGGLMGGAGGGASPIQGVLMNMLGGGQQQGMQQGGMQQGGMQQPGMMGGGMGGMGGGMMGGGLGGLLSAFEGAGLGHIAQSWVGNGANSPFSPQQLQNVFGDKIPGMAQQAGMEPGDFLSQLSQHLPNAVNGMTPNGQLPADGAMDV